MAVKLTFAFYYAMRKAFLSLIRQFLFWIVFFNLTRLVFLIYYLKILLVEQITFVEISSVFPHSLKLDVATTCYILIFPYLILLIQLFYSPKWLNLVNKIFSGILIFGYSLTVAGEMGIYAEWKTKLTYKVIKYLNHPSEIFNSAETGTFFLLVFVFLSLVFAGTYIYIRFFYPDIEKSRFHPQSLAFAVLTPGILFIGLRGGMQQIPINQSESYFSDHNILNLAAVNNGFNLYISIFENLQNFSHNPYIFMNPEKASGIMKKIYQTPVDTTVHVLKTDRPNIVLFILESWSADLIEDLGGKSGITPEFRKFQQNGILFDQIYASGSRSEQGMASIFSGFPAHPVSSITVQPDKFVKLPSVIKDLNKAGYSTAFYFGGQLIYGNIKSYIIFNGFNKVMEGTDFPKQLPQGKLGIHDQYTLSYLLDDLAKMKQPFFASLFTLSTHSPWDQPFEKSLKWGDNEREYINAAYYTDHCLGQFYEKAKRLPWFKNTLFIIVADHSHNSYRNWHPESKEYHKIPMLFFGNVIRDEFKGTRWNKLGNQQDIPVTLLEQLNLASPGFEYSKNLFNPYSPDFAYYSTEDGVGWIKPDTYFTYEKTSNFYYWWNDPNLADSVKQEGFAYLQTVFADYMNK